jgi:glucosamine-6-phosphate deaminase
VKIIVTENYNALSTEAAKIIEAQLTEKKDSILGLATGSTPLGTYKELIKMCKESGLSFKDVISFNLDEYIGLDENSEKSYRHFMNENLFKDINIKSENTYVPDGMAKDPAISGKQYDEAILAKGGIDLQILGIGSNGHIAFNEPAENLSVGTTVVELTENTIQDNARFFEDIKDVPTEAITMGIGSIMRAKKIILLASGTNKADIMGKLLNNSSINTQIPASLLLLHPDVTIICDSEAYKRVEK